MRGEFERRIEEWLIERYPEVPWKDGVSNESQIIARFLNWLDEARKAFPVKFMWDEVTEDIWGKQHVSRVEMPPSAGLPENRANAVIDKKELLDWFIEWYVE